MVSKDRSATLTEPYEKVGAQIMTVNDIISLKQLYSCSGANGTGEYGGNNIVDNNGGDGGDY